MVPSRVIEVRAAGYTYPGAAGPALSGLDFHVGAGEIFGFLGPSGSGKSTTQKLLTGLLGRYQGEVRVFGRTLRELGRAYYDRIGVAFEVPNIYAKLTGRENLLFFASLHVAPSADPEELLSLVGLTYAADERAVTYSKGMRMRLNFARALLTNPELLFLDEPTTGQDPENARRIKGIIRARRDSGATIFLTTHDMSVAGELCDRVAFLVNGRIVLVDAPRELMINYGDPRVRVEYRTDGTLEQEDFDLDTLATNERFLRLLRDRQVETIHTKDATLEEVFIKVTGRPLA